MRVKICGLTDAEAVAHAAAAGADYVGLVFFPPSPRALSIEEAQALAAAAPAGVRRVALTVDADDLLLARLVRAVPLEMLQFHGHESPERVEEIRARHGLPVMKVVSIADAADLPRIAEYEDAADQLMIDAKPPPGATRPGGNALAFDWQLIAGRTWRRPWMLAGGLTHENVAEAIRLTGATQVDVSSGVEAVPGVKDMEKVSAFIAAAKATARGPADHDRR
jgi:phosphoribosylanthranilate isomerase